MFGPFFAMNTGVMTRSRTIELDSDSTTSRQPRPPFKAFPRLSVPSTKGLASSLAIDTSSNNTNSQPTSTPASTPRPMSVQSRAGIRRAAAVSPDNVDEQSFEIRNSRPRSPRLPIRRPSLPLPLRRPSVSPSFEPPDFPMGDIRTQPDPKNAQGSKATPASPDDRELLVIAHGLQGTAEDFKFVIQTLRSSRACVNGQLFIHTSRVNTDRTHDGVAAGGRRLATDIRIAIDRAILEGKPFNRLSLIGFSLGGIYVRYAAAELYDAERETFAGLTGGSMILVASPNLGVRRFGVYRFVPEAVKGVKVLGDTVREMMLMDDERILERMSKDDDGEFEDEYYDAGEEDSEHENECVNAPDGSESNSTVGRKGKRGGRRLLFMASLKSFEFRALYTNIRNDLMVNFGTACFEPAISDVNGAQLDRVINTLSRFPVDGGHDERGCKVCFRYWMDGDSNKAREVAVNGADSSGNDEVREVVMAQRLRSVGWWVVGIDFPLAFPIAHNRIVAMSRNMLHSWINNAGERVVHHLVDTLCERFGEHERVFRRTDSDGDLIESFI